LAVCVLVELDVEVLVLVTRKIDVEPDVLESRNVVLHTLVEVLALEGLQACRNVGPIQTNIQDAFDSLLGVDDAMVIDGFADAGEIV
jgi:hypothetical protein